MKKIMSHKLNWVLLAVYILCLPFPAWGINICIEQDNKPGEKNCSEKCSCKKSKADTVQTHEALLPGKSICDDCICLHFKSVAEDSEFLQESQTKKIICFFALSSFLSLLLFKANKNTAIVKSAFTNPLSNLPGTVVLRI
jgi:hypothetical protein